MEKMHSGFYTAQIESYIYGTWKKCIQVSIRLKLKAACMTRGRNAFRFLCGSNLKLHIWHMEKMPSDFYTAEIESYIYGTWKECFQVSIRLKLKDPY
jgi:hypothetical protein